MTRPIGEVVPTVLQRARRQHETLHEIQEAWSRLVGKRLAIHTKPVSLRRGKLIVHVARPGDNFALSFQRDRLSERLREATQGRVGDVVIRAGEV